MCNGLSKSKQSVCRYEQNLKQTPQTILENSAETAVFDWNDWPISAKSVQGVIRLLARILLDSLHGFCTDWPIVPIKYSDLSAVAHITQHYCTCILNNNAQFCIEICKHIAHECSVYEPTVLHMYLQYCTLFDKILLFLCTQAKNLEFLAHDIWNLGSLL